jgi:hypothetical protein
MKLMCKHLEIISSESFLRLYVHVLDVWLGFLLYEGA